MPSLRTWPGVRAENQAAGLQEGLPTHLQQYFEAHAVQRPQDVAGQCEHAMLSWRPSVLQSGQGYTSGPACFSDSAGTNKWHLSSAESRKGASSLWWLGALTEV